MKTTELHKKFSKMSTKDLSAKLTKVNADEETVIAEILAKRENKGSVTVMDAKIPAKKPAPGAKKSAAKAPAKSAPKAAAKKAAPVKKEAAPKAPKKKSEKIGDSKSDKIRVMLKEGKDSGEIIEAFANDGITVRYPEIRRNRIWLTEKEGWVAPEPKVKEKKEKAEKPAKTPAKKAAAKKAAK